jgi:hypothetical protein
MLAFDLLLLLELLLLLLLLEEPMGMSPMLVL